MTKMYSMIDETGMIIRSQYTDNPDAAVLDGCRLLPDEPPQQPDPVNLVQIDLYVRVEPVLSSSTSVQYNMIRRNFDDVSDDVRAVRNMFLKESDWTQLSDSQLDENQLQLWREYRQKLRILPQQPEFPFNIIFPEMP